MGVQVSKILEHDKKCKPKTEPQIDDEMYAKWLTDKYHKDVKKLKRRIEELEVKLKREEKRNKILSDNANSKRLKYTDECNNFRKELMKDETVMQYKKTIETLRKTIKRLREHIESLVVENNKLKSC